jgi:hypothetical protein
VFVVSAPQARVITTGAGTWAHPAWSWPWRTFVPFSWFSPQGVTVVCRINFTLPSPQSTAWMSSRNCDFRHGLHCCGWMGLSFPVFLCVINLNGTGITSHISRTVTPRMSCDGDNNDNDHHLPAATTTTALVRLVLLDVPEDVTRLSSRTNKNCQNMNEAMVLVHAVAHETVTDHAVAVGRDGNVAFWRAQRPLCWHVSAVVRPGRWPSQQPQRPLKGDHDPPQLRLSRSDQNKTSPA